MAALLALLTEMFWFDSHSKHPVKRAIWMSGTIICNPSTEPGAAAVTFLPKMMEHPEPGGVNWTARKSSPAV
jgi:hypothetical protein